MADTIEIRKANQSDYDALGEVMYDAVRNGPSQYTDEQRVAWVSHPRSGESWNERLSPQTIFLAQAGNEIVGFMSLAIEGYVDFAFIRPSSQGSGLFRKLFNEVQREAVERSENRLWVHASLMAQPAFSAVGFTTLNPEQVESNGQTFDRFVMEKKLKGPDEFGKT